MTGREGKQDARKKRNDAVREQVQQVLMDIDSVERTGMPVARVRFVQLARQAGARLNLRLWKTSGQGMQEAGEEALGRLLDGKWRRPKGGGEPRFSNTNEPWVLNLWDAAIGQWDLEKEKPKQGSLLEPPPKFSDRLDRAAKNTHQLGSLRTAIYDIRDELRRQGL